MLALANLANAAEVIKEIFGERIAIIPFIMPGFKLAKVAAKIFETNSDVEGLLLLNHGHFAFGDTAKQSYDRLIEQTNTVEAWLKNKGGVVPKPESAPKAKTVAKAADILPILRGIIGDRLAVFTGNRDEAMPVMSLRAGDNVEEFFSRPDLRELSRRGVATPDHVIRTKNYPLYITQDILDGGRAAIKKSVDDYIVEYTKYFVQNASRFNIDPATAKTMLPPTPNLAWIESVGVVGISADSKSASTASDLAEQNIAAMTYGQQCGGYYPIDEERLFDMEYWSLEQAKISKSKPPKLQGKVVMITGGCGAIGLATAKSFAAFGANVFLIDVEQISCG